MKKILFLTLFIPCSVLAQRDVGIEFYSFRNQFAVDVPGTIEKISKMGFTIAEGGDSYKLPVEEFKKLLDKNHISVISVGANFNELDSNAEAVVKRARFYGAKYVVCFWIPHNGTDFTITDIENAIRVFNKAGKALKENGLTFCYHPHGFEFRPHSNGTLFDHLMQSTDSANVNYEMDVFWVKHPGQDPVALLKKYPGRFKLMHLKDRKPGTEGNQNGTADDETNVVLGTGDVGIGDIMRVARKYGVKYFFIEDESPRSEQQVPQSLGYLRTLKY